MIVCFVDRIGAHAIWGVINPIASKLISEGHIVYYVRMDDGGSRGNVVFPDGIKIFDLSVPAKKGIRGLIQQQWCFARQFSTLLNRLRPDVVHTNFAATSIVARLMSFIKRIPFVVSTQHELYDSMRLHYRVGLKLTEHICSAVVYVSHTVASSFNRHTVEYGEISAKKSTNHIVITNGVDVEKIRKAIAVVNGKVPYRVVCAGRMVLEKGQHLLIEALPEIISYYPSFALHLIGAGPMEDRLRRRVVELGVERNVKFFGWLPHEELLKEMASAEIVVVPSENEGFGLVAAESLVCGARLLLSDIPVFQELAKDITGHFRLFARGNIGDLTRSLTDMLLERNSGLKLSDNDIAKLSSRKMAESYFELYMRLSDSH